MDCGFKNQMSSKTGFFAAGILTGSFALAWAQQAARPQPPTRDPHTPGYVQANTLPDGTVPPSDKDGNFILGPTHTPAPEMTAPELTHGAVVEFTMN